MSTQTPPPGDWIRGLTVKQPWTAAILTGAQTIANTPQAWSWRGWLLLHASPTIDRTALRHPLVRRTVHGRELLTGAVLGVVRLTDCHQDGDGGLLCSPWALPDAWHLVLADAQELPLPVPAPVRGQLTGPWKPTPDLLAQVCQQLPGLRP
ncbi:hypothetical protein [Streptomyces sp. NPDC017941]|uniref:hypothetical protein n=1 Tax=unclassified Streptomyces TaxID=2593676 RepID=UPI00378856E6